MSALACSLKLTMSAIPLDESLWNLGELLTELL
jgi:hypothetical protein